MSPPWWRARWLFEERGEIERLLERIDALPPDSKLARLTEALDELARGRVPPGDGVHAVYRHHGLPAPRPPRAGRLARDYPMPAVRQERGRAALELFEAPAQVRVGVLDSRWLLLGLEFLAHPFETLHGSRFHRLSGVQPCMDVGCFGHVRYPEALHQNLHVLHVARPSGLELYGEQVFRRGSCHREVRRVVKRPGVSVCLPWYRARRLFVEPVVGEAPLARDFLDRLHQRTVAGVDSRVHVPGRPAPVERHAHRGSVDHVDLYAGSRELELPGEVVEQARQPFPIKIGAPIHWCLPCAR